MATTTPAPTQAPRGWRTQRGRTRWPDDRLVSATRSGDAEAFEVIYDRYARPILGFCRHMLGSAADAEDAVQEIFASAYRALQGEGRRIELRPWLYAIARNRCLSVLRARRESDVLEEDVGGNGESLPEIVQRREDLRSLVDDVRRLPEDQRAALLLAELADMPHEQLAEVIGCRKEKVKALVFQARSTLLADREAREVICRDVRMAIAADGRPPTRGPLKRHLRVCPVCSEYAGAVRGQRAALALALPVVPSAALKARTLAAALGGGGAPAAATAGTAAGGAAFGGLGQGVLVKALAALAVAGSAGAGAAAIATHSHRDHRATASPAVSHAASPARAIVSATPAAAAPASLQATLTRHHRARQHARHSAASPVPPTQASGAQPLVSQAAAHGVSQGAKHAGFALGRGTSGAPSRSRSGGHAPKAPAVRHSHSRGGGTSGSHRTTHRSRPVSNSHGSGSGTAAPSHANPGNHSSSSSGTTTTVTHLSSRTTATSTTALPSTGAAIGKAG